MSKHSFSYNLNQGKYSLKFIIYLFLLLDVMLFFSIPFEIFGNVVSWEVLVFGGMLIGIRVQGRYKEMVYDMIALRQDPKYDRKEDLRGHRMIRLIDRMMIDYDLYLEKQNKKHKKTIKKKNSFLGFLKNSKNKKKGGRKIMLWDRIVQKQAGYALIAILGVLDLGLTYLLAIVGWHWILIFVIAGIWGILDGFLFFYIHYVFKIEVRAKAKDDVNMSGPVIFDKTTGNNEPESTIE